MDFQEVAYRKQAADFDQDLSDPRRLAIGRTWFDKTTADYWRHSRMYEAVDAFRSEADSRWLTVGDGRYGLDAIRIREKGFRFVLPTNISATLLAKAKEDGRIDDYAVENAEALSFQDGSFDYVFCKESYHHFPRPAVALYEMLRVARKAVILIEPNDLSSSLFTLVKQRLRNLIRGRTHFDAANYEDSGNYMYSISRREMEKVALGLNLPIVASKSLSDTYITGCEFQPASWRSPYYRRIRLRCALQDALAALSLHYRPVLMAVIFKQQPAPAVLGALSSRRWKVVALPRNPYV
jgi:SAM-dependent methyltransferase